MIIIKDIFELSYLKTNNIEFWIDFRTDQMKCATLTRSLQAILSFTPESQSTGWNEQKDISKWSLIRVSYQLPLNNPFSWKCSEKYFKYWKKNFLPSWNFIYFCFFPGQILRCQVLPEEYESKLVDHSLIKIHAIATVSQTRQTWSEEDDFPLIKPPLDIKV